MYQSNGLKKNSVITENIKNIDTIRYSHHLYNLCLISLFINLIFNCYTSICTTIKNIGFTILLTCKK